MKIWPKAARAWPFGQVAPAKVDKAEVVHDSCPRQPPTTIADVNINSNRHVAQPDHQFFETALWTQPCKGDTGIVADELDHTHGMKAMIGNTILPTILEEVVHDRFELEMLHQEIDALSQSSPRVCTSYLCASTTVKTSCETHDTCWTDVVQKYNKRKLHLDRVCHRVTWSAQFYEVQPCTEIKTRVQLCHEFEPNYTNGSRRKLCVATNIS
eukprot:659968-Amphidinium_carterae.5